MYNSLKEKKVPAYLFFTYALLMVVVFILSYQNSNLLATTISTVVLVSLAILVGVGYFLFHMKNASMVGYIILLCYHIMYSIVNCTYAADINPNAPTIINAAFILKIVELLPAIIILVLAIVNFTNNKGNFGKIIVVLLILIGLINFVAELMAGIYGFSSGQEMGGVIYILSGFAYLALYLGFASDIENIKMTF